MHLSIFDTFASPRFIWRERWTESQGANCLFHETILQAIETANKQKNLLARKIAKTSGGYRGHRLVLPDQSLWKKSKNHSLSLDQILTNNRAEFTQDVVKKN